MLQKKITPTSLPLTLHRIRVQPTAIKPDMRIGFKLSLRCFAWSVVALMTTYLLNCYLSFWKGWPTALQLFKNSEFDELSILQFAFYIIAVMAAVLFVILTSEKRTMHSDSELLNQISAFITRSAFWSVLLVGLVDAIISFLRVEGFLEYFVGVDLTKAMAQSYIRATYIHIPLCAVGVFIASRRTKTDFGWLALLVVSAELFIVITRFVFSYEQAFMGDLVRFWYAAMFLFASAYTLRMDQHVRVDVLYCTLSQNTRSKINAIGSVLLGMLFCWTILLIGMWTKSSILIAPLLGFEVSQSGYGMYVKYLMAGFLLIFAVSMMLQFVSSLLENAAKYYNECEA
ncbi:MAG: hypothetical protein TECD_00801 [Hyphomicrobiaceae bacterium hypho_1]